MSIPDFGASFRDTVFPGSSDPLTTFNFVVMIGTRPLGDFANVSGIKYEVPYEKVYEGGRNHSPHLLPFGDKNAGSWSTVTLEWGSPVWSVLYDWISAVQVGAHFRRDVFILQLNRNGWPARIMRLHNAFPVAWQAPDLSTESSKAKLEKLTLAFESFNHILTRVGSLPSLDSLAATAGGLAGLFEDAFNDAIDGVVDGANDFASLFDPDTYDDMDDAFNNAYDPDPIEWAATDDDTPTTSAAFSSDTEEEDESEEEEASESPELIPEAPMTSTANFGSSTGTEAPELSEAEDLSALMADAMAPSTDDEDDDEETPDLDALMADALSPATGGDGDDDDDTPDLDAAMSDAMAPSLGSDDES